MEGRPSPSRRPVSSYTMGMRIPEEKAREAFMQNIGTALAPLDPRVIYLFGTYGTEYQRPDSDVDLAFLASRPADSDAVSRAADALSETLHRDVDLIDLRAAPTTLRPVVLEEGECLSCLDARLREEFEMYAFSDQRTMVLDQRLPLHRRQRPPRPVRLPAEQEPA